jgi:hypothetical protein
MIMTKVAKPLCCWLMVNTCIGGCMMRTLSLWSLQFSVARGLHWKFERDVTEETADQWQNVFQADAPGVQFAVSVNRPRLPKLG